MELAKRILLAIALLLGLMLPARANLEREFTYTLHPDTPHTSYNAALNHFDHFTRQTFFNCIDRVNGQPTGTIVSGEFTIEFNPDFTASITWDFTSTDHSFLGVYVAGVNGPGNLYENVNDPEDNEFHGTAEIHAPRDRGERVAISHIDFFCGREEVPELGGTLGLLVIAMAGLHLIRRRTLRVPPVSTSPLLA